MNEQTKLSEVDSLRLANLTLRGQLVERDRQIVALETKLFQMQVHAAYGNPGEAIEITSDNRLIRTPRPPVP